MFNRQFPIDVKDPTQNMFTPEPPYTDLSITAEGCVCLDDVPKANVWMLWAKQQIKALEFSNTALNQQLLSAQAKLPEIEAKLKESVEAQAALQKWVDYRRTNSTECYPVGERVSFGVPSIEGTVEEAHFTRAGVSYFVSCWQGGIKHQTLLHSSEVLPSQQDALPLPNVI